MTNNPAKYTGLKGYGLEVTERVAVITEVTEDNAAYIQTKRERMGHFWDGDDGDLKAFASAETGLESDLQAFADPASLLDLAKGTHGHDHHHHHHHHHHPARGGGGGDGGGGDRGRACLSPDPVARRGRRRPAGHSRGPSQHWRRPSGRHRRHPRSDPSSRAWSECRQRC